MCRRRPVEAIALAQCLRGSEEGDARLSLELFEELGVFLLCRFDLRLCALRKELQVREEAV